ncbi:hypothetical protein FB45DRAFT_1067125 [Roridomyces roridus]|uniref:F-box domain-containing protein n=1 Tax=Roridomyces roridus TaxID=1738132 RepID=A0AAD7B3S1_9AGAR|nr:hypothetical protein FB45DRAFT_1067125 [Roridomyces roridus]
MASSCPECGSPNMPKPQTIPATTETLERWQHLVTSNDTPAGAELAFIQSVVSDSGARLDYLDSEISRLQDRLDQLQGERTRLSAYHSLNTSILSPLRRMPPEILVQIFVWTLPTSHERSGDVYDTQRSPWTLAQVSSRWREIALSTPSLWSMIHITFPDDDDDEDEEEEDEDEEEHWHRDILQAQLQRSGTLNLKIQFYGCEQADSTEQLALFDLLSKHSARWEALNIQLSSALAPRLAQLRGRLPVLRRLWLQWDSEKSQVGIDSITCFKTAPSLVDAGVNNGSRFIPILVPAHQLTTYRLHGPWKMHLHVLELAPNIVEARIVADFDVDEAWPAPGAQAINLLHLQRLYVSNERMLDYLRTPRLADLCVQPVDEDLVVDSLDALFLRSACAPQRLYLKEISSTATTLAILKKYPFITTIALTFFKDGVDAMEAHLTMLTDVSECQHLREICFGALESMLIDYPLFLRMLKARRQSSLRAASFLAAEGPDPDPVTLVGLHELRDGGLDLRLQSDQQAQDCVTRWENGFVSHEGDD